MWGVLLKADYDRLFWYTLKVRVIIPLLLVFGLLLVGGGVVASLVLRNRQASARPLPSTAGTLAPKSPTSPPGFRWTYVLPPLLVFLASVFVALIFYRMLPARVGYRFQSDGTPDAWVGKGVLVAVLLVPQFLLALAAGIIALAVTKVGGLMKAGEGAMSSLSSVVAIMSNMVLLPQIVLFFAAVDIFSYNAYQFHFLSPLISALLVMVIGGFVLMFLFYRAVQRMRTIR